MIKRIEFVVYISVRIADNDKTPWAVEADYTNLRKRK